MKALTFLWENPSHLRMKKLAGEMLSNKKKLVYRAGTEECPLLDLQYNTAEVWLVRNPVLYYPLYQDQLPSRQNTRANPSVHLWETDITKSDFLNATDHPIFKGVCVVKYKGIGCIEKELQSLTWERSTVPKCRGGMSLIDDSTLVQAVLIYMKDHYPKTPKDFNSHAELKAASHWHWSDDDNRSLEPITNDNSRVKSAAEYTLKKWQDELNKLSLRQEDAVSRFSVEEKRASDLEEGIFALKTYFDMDMEEIDRDTEPKTDQSYLTMEKVGEEVERRSKKPRNKFPPQGQLKRKNGFLKC